VRCEVEQRLVPHLRALVDEVDAVAVQHVEQERGERHPLAQPATSAELAVREPVTWNGRRPPSSSITMASPSSTRSPPGSAATASTTSGTRSVISSRLRV
jgi:hypothetical protein